MYPPWLWRGLSGSDAPDEREPQRLLSLVGAAIVVNAPPQEARHPRAPNLEESELDPRDMDGLAAQIGLGDVAGRRGGS